MINNKADYISYLNADRKVNKIYGMRRFLVTWKYLKCMRKLEFLSNNKSRTYMLLRLFYKIKLYRLSVKSGITIPINTFGKGLYLPHHGSIVVNHKAKFGDYCVIQNGVNI